MFDPVFDDEIYVGGIATMFNQEDVRDEDITAIVRLDQVPRDEGQWESDFKLLDVPISDGELVSEETLDTVTAFIKARMDAGERVLVHCYMGISRSVTMVMAYLIAYENMSLAEAFGTVREGRANAYPHEALLVSLIDHYNLPYDVGTVYNPAFLAKLVEDV